MHNLLFVTVGVSAIRDWIIDDPKKSDLRDLLKQMKRDPLSSNWSVARMDLIQWHRSRWAMFALDAPELIGHTSAELLTTAKILHQLSVLSPSIDVDTIVLLASTTPEGQLAAEVNKEVMESSEYRVTARKPRVVVESIPAPSSQSVETLSDCILEAVSKHRESEHDRVIFNITAGFGGVNTLIGMQAVYYGYRLCYQHKTMQQPVYIGQNLKAYTSPEPWIIS
jgi:putative CRISPR-associated protein (TIGR02619 family)